MVAASLTRDATAVAAIPSACMLLGSACVFCFQTVHPKFQAAFQNLSAGIILAAVAGELFPLITHGVTIAPWQADIGIIVGFIVGLLALFGVKYVTEKFEGEEEGSSKIVPNIESGERDEEQKENDSLPAGGAKTLVGTKDLREDFEHMDKAVKHLQEHIDRADPSRAGLDKHVHQLQHYIDNTRRHIRCESSTIPEISKLRLSKILIDLSDLVSSRKAEINQVDSVVVNDLEAYMLLVENLIHSMEATYEVWRPPARYTRWSKILTQPPPPAEHIKEAISWGLVICVVIDAGVDGLLIGLSYAATPHAGYIMAAATCIEMGFLGLTFSATLRAMTKRLWLHAVLIILPPLMIVVAGTIGGALGGALEEQPGVFVGFIAFAIVALLFLVTQELLLQAHENAGEDVWWINVWIFGGVLLVLVLERHLN